jgi:hypothetical protein
MKSREQAEKKRCQALDANGRQCRRTDTSKEQYHGDNELYDHWSGKPTWVKVSLCSKHSTK